MNMKDQLQEVLSKQQATKEKAANCQKLIEDRVAEIRALQTLSSAPGTSISVDDFDTKSAEVNVALLLASGELLDEKTKKIDGCISDAAKQYINHEMAIIASDEKAAGEPIFHSFETLIGGTQRRLESALLLIAMSEELANKAI